MALALSRHLRRAIPLSSHLLRPLLLPPPQIRPVNPVLQTRLFKSSPQLLNYRSDFKGSDENRISPDEILFEGCDYKHWLITMDFPKDPAPSPEEMVETYVQTCAQVLGSVEEAKRRIYACSTTTYQGFQVEVDEETSEKFRGLPGVVFILPDSYLYPETKEYGGDKYENGVITPRPPPIQYGTQNRRRERNRFEQSQNRPFDNQQGNLRNYPPQQGNFGNYPPQQQQGNLQNYPPDGPNRHGGNLRNYPPNEQQQGNFQNYPPNQQGGNFQNYPPNQQGGNFQNYPPNQQGRNFQNYPPNQQRGTFQNYPSGQQGGNLQNYPPNRQGGFENYPPQQDGNLQNYPPQRGRDGGYQRDYNQGQRGNFAQGPTPGYGGDEGWKERR